MLILGVYGNIKPPASFKGCSTGLDLKLVQLAKLNLTRQSSALASPPKLLTALTISPTASPAAGKLMDLIALPMLSALVAPANAPARLLAAPNPFVTAPIAFCEEDSAEFKSKAIIIFLFWYIIYLTLLTA
jgi:hypothetical protein